MEKVNNLKEIKNLNNNEIYGKPELLNSNITFSGKNNILYCEYDVKLINSNIVFGGDNSIVYLSNSQSKYPLNLQIFSDSVIYIGKDTVVNTININVQEHQNLIIGDECILGNGSTLRTSDAHPIFDLNSKNRINDSKSVYIGDHVWVGHQAYVGAGSLVGSGAILDANCYVKGVILESNNLYSGNPVILVKNNVFFTNTYVGAFHSNDSIVVEDYTSNIYHYQYTEGETLNIYKVDEILNTFNVDEKLEFIQKLFIQNKKHDRFFI